MTAVVRAAPHTHLHVVDLPYRFCSWAFDDPANGALWYDSTGTVLAWAVLQSPFWAIDYALHPDAPTGTIHTVLRWIGQRIQAVRETRFARPMWFVNVFTDHIDTQVLESYGFVSQAHVRDNPWTKLLLHQDAAHLPARPALPQGLHIRPLNGQREVAAYVALHRAVFGSDSMTQAWRERTLQHPLYQPQLDLVLVDAADHLAGFCIGWYATHGPQGQPSGQIEPMGIRADLRSRGLAKAVLLEAIHRLRAAGATSLFVETDTYRDSAFHLYQAAGFQVMREVVVLRKDDPPRTM